MEELLKQLAQAVKDLNEAVGTKFSAVDTKQADDEKNKLVQRVLDLETSIKEIRKAKAVQKMVFAVQGKQAGDGEQIVTFGEFMKAVNRRDEKWLTDSGVIKAANGQSEGTSADGGYTVPVEFSNEIVKLERLFGVARRIGRLIPMGSLTRKVSRQLTHPTMTYTDEAVNHTKTKATFDQITQTAKKLSALIPVTEELLADNNVNLDQFLFQIVAEGMARTEDTQAFAGSGSPFTGVANASGVNTVTQSGANPGYDDLAELMFAVGAGYRQNASWVLDSAALKLVMKIKNDNGDPIWGMPVAGQPGTILGKPYSETDVLSSKILFGDFGRYLWISDRGTYEVKASDSASDANGGAGSAFLQDEIWYKFRKRHSIDVVLPAAFSVMTAAAA